MRPRQIKTLKDLQDFLDHAVRRGAKPTDKILMWADDEEIQGLAYPTIMFTAGDADCDSFFTIEYWTDDELTASAEHNDRLGTQPHYIS